MTLGQEQVDAYAKIYPDYQAFSNKMRILLEDILRANDIQYQVIEARPKSVESFKEKLTRLGKNYSDGLAQLPDLCGCRIITYYLEDVEKSSELMKKEFSVVEEELSHLPSALQANQFGYLSAHYVVRLNDTRLRLPEWASYSEFKAEIQIRTVIQHAWSAVSHAMQYKAESEVPSTLQRRLNRIAGLFELADEEFGAVRKQRAAIRAEVSAAVMTGNLTFSLTVSSIEEFARSWGRMEAVVAAAEESGFDVIEYNDEDTPGNVYDLAQRSNILSLYDLEQAVSKQDTNIFEKIFNLQQLKSDWRVSRLFLIYLLLIGNQRDKVNHSYLVDRGWSEDIAQRVCLALAS